MKCPKDGYDLVSSTYHGVQIETCPHCGGMWVDAGRDGGGVARAPARPCSPACIADALSSLKRVRDWEQR